MENQNAVEGAQFQLFTTYISEIQSRYKSAGPDIKMRLLGSLDKLVRSYAVHGVVQEDFEGDVARKLRESKKITLRDLADQLGIKSPQTIGNYERGNVSPGNRRTANARRYLEWVKQQSKSSS